MKMILKSVSKVTYDDGTEEEFNDEPAYILRGRDAFTAGLLVVYGTMCRREYLLQQAKEVGRMLTFVRLWQNRNKDEVKLPSGAPGFPRAKV